MKRILLFASALALAACSNGSSSGSAPAGGVPGKLNDHPVVSKPALTGNEKTAIKSFSAKMEKMPDSSLFLPSQDETDTDRTERAKKKAKLSQDGRMNYDKIQNNCQFQFPQPTGTQESQTITSSISGGACPINFTQTLHNEMVSQPGGKSATFKSSANGTLQVLDPSMQAQVGYVKATSNFTSSGAFTGSEQSSSSFMSGTGGITLQTLNGQNASMGMTFEMLVSENKMTSYMEMNFALDSIQATVQVYMETGSQGAQSARLFLNGQPTTEAELKEIFGDNFTIQTSQN